MCHLACRILVPNRELDLGPLQWKCKVPTRDHQGGAVEGIVNDHSLGIKFTRYTTARITLDICPDIFPSYIIC